MPSFEDRPNYPSLHRFLTTSFHQDWDLEASDDEAVVRICLEVEGST